MLQEPVRPFAPEGESWSGFIHRTRIIHGRLAAEFDNQTVLGITRAAFLAVDSSWHPSARCSIFVLAAVRYPQTPHAPVLSVVHVDYGMAALGRTMDVAPLV